MLNAMTFLFTLLDFILTQARVSTLCDKPSSLKLFHQIWVCHKLATLQPFWLYSSFQQMRVMFWNTLERFVMWKYEMIWLVFQTCCRWDQKAAALCLERQEPISNNTGSSLSQIQAAVCLRVCGGGSDTSVSLAPLNIDTYMKPGEKFKGKGLHLWVLHL